MHMLSWTLAKSNVKCHLRPASSHGWLCKSGVPSLQRTYTSRVGNGWNHSILSPRLCKYGPVLLGRVCPLPDTLGCRNLAWLPRLPSRPSESCNEPSDGLEEAAKVAILEKAMKARQPTDLMLRCTFCFISRLRPTKLVTRYRIGCRRYGPHLTALINTC